LRLSQDFHETLDVKKAGVRVSVRKPARQQFIGLPADPAFRLETAILHLTEEREIDLLYGGYERTFKLGRFAQYLVRNDMPCPTLVSGSLDLCDDRFKDMARAYPLLARLRELRYRSGMERALSVKLTAALLRAFAVGQDAKARALQPLEQAGLVTVAKTPGRNPRVTVLELPE
jgi:hypothetical protein